ncbi:glycosyltransferase, partial [uncultured Enterovirga sp.]|uniref:glycosyltransferase n=1 Tax=uncultured Enterovirga sp. TaxID=2026352 RepID=UPI0035CB5B43
DSIVGRSTFKNYRILVLDNGRMQDDVSAHLRGLGVRIERYAFEPPFNFPRKANAGFAMVETEDVILLNDDVEVISPDWIEALVGLTGRPGIGAAGARLLYPNGRVQHQGVALGVMGATTHVFHNLPADAIGYNGYTHLIRNYSCVTGAVLATRMSLVRELGCFDASFSVDFNDADYCLRLGRAGYRVVYSPFAQLYHFEGTTLARSVVTAPDETAFRARWGETIDTDPYYNPNLPRDRGDYAVAIW